MYFFKEEIHKQRTFKTRVYPFILRDLKKFRGFLYRYSVIAHTIGKREKFIYHDVPCTQTPPNRDSLPDEASIN